MAENEVPYYEELVNIRSFLEKNLENFPTLRCQHTARFLKKELGLKEVAGYYIPLQDYHAWSYDSELKLYIDLTMDQFSQTHNKIIILPVENIWLKSHPNLTSNHLMTPDSHFEPKIEYLLNRFKEEYKIRKPTQNYQTLSSKLQKL